MTHHHHHHAEAVLHDGSQRRIYIFAIILNAVFVGVEVMMGFFADSLGLISDAGHNLGDVFSLVLALLAVQLASSHATKHFTYGYRKSSVLIAMLNAIILLVAVGAILIESFEKLSINDANTAINGGIITWTAGIGILINGVTAWMLHHGSSHDINARGAYLHMLADTLVSVGVVISGIIITYTGWGIIDPIVSIIIAVIILISTWNLLSESIRMSIDAVPENIDPDEVRSTMMNIGGVSDVHHLHIWAISTHETALTAHVLISNKEEMERITHDVKHALSHLGINHSTLELETNLSDCHETTCS